MNNNVSMSFSNPFSKSSSRPGHGSIVVGLLPPATPVLQTVSYQYPLKLIAPDAITANEQLVHAVFLLTYGGGLVAGDTIDLDIVLRSGTRLSLLTQGSTKIFNTPDPKKLSGQVTNVTIEDGSALCYLPDPVQPFAQSAFSQCQYYHLSSLTESSMCACDWVCEGRPAREERWNFYTYTSKNEVWLKPSNDGVTERLLIRDNLILDDSGCFNTALAPRVDHLGVYGTLIVRGRVFEATGNLFIEEFEHLQRIGARRWDDTEEEAPLSRKEAWRNARQKQERRDGLLWTAARIRGFVLVKFGAREVEGAKKWLYAMLKAAGCVEKEFGERALLCLR